MPAARKELFPLSETTDEELADLCDALFGWTPSASLFALGNAQTTDSPADQPHSDLEAFFSYYKYVTTNYLPEVVGSYNTALRSHKDLHGIIKLLRNQPETARLTLTNEYFHQRAELTGEPSPPLADQEQAFNIAVRVITMILPSAENQSDGLLEAGLQPRTWTNDQSLRDFVNFVYPQREHPALKQNGDLAAMAEVRLASITARRLKKVASLEIIPTSDMRNHLLLDEKKGTVSVFHFTSFLKESLCAGNIPSDLAIETLATIKELLFSNDAYSHAVLQSLVSKKGFDSDILRIVECPQYMAAVKKPVSYVYWGTRLMELYDELENPTPRGFLERWLERKSGARYMMLATIAGIAFAILLGIIGVGLGAFQAWVAWQQWQHPLE